MTIEKKDIYTAFTVIFAAKKQTNLLMSSWTP